MNPDIKLFSKRDDIQDDLIAAYIRPLLPEIVPSPTFVLRTRRMLLKLSRTGPDKTQGA